MRGKGKYLRKDSKLYGHLQEAMIMYQNGNSTVEIAEKFGLDHANVYRILKSHGIKMRTQSQGINIAIAKGRKIFLKGENSHSWKGGIVKHTKGYILIKKSDHPRRDKRGYVFEHIIVAEEKIGRRLNPNECVHHINEIKNDNRPNNLQIMTISEHMRLHAKMNNGRIGINHKKEK